MITPTQKQIPESQFPSLHLEIRHDRWFHLPSIPRFAQLDFEERLCWDTVVLDKVLYLFQVSNDFFLLSFFLDIFKGCIPRGCLLTTSRVLLASTLTCGRAIGGILVDADMTADDNEQQQQWV
jgi:hypothetical protein